MSATMTTRDKIIKLRQEIAYLFLNIEQAFSTTIENDGKSIDSLKKKFSSGARWLTYMDNLIQLDEKDNKLADALNTKDLDYDQKMQIVMKNRSEGAMFMRRNKNFATSLRLALMASMTKKPRSTFQDLDTIEERFSKRKRMNSN